MSQDLFYEGLEIQYKVHSGHVKFICEQYITMCVHTNKDPMRDVCILIYQDQWKNIELLSGNRTREENR